MQVILKEEMENLGGVGDMVEVKRGYARNYLIPRDLAVEATPNNVKRFEHQKRVVAARVDKLKKASASLADKISETTVQIRHRVGEDEKIFGTVTNMEIAEALKAQGIEIDRRKIALEEPIKRLGEFTAAVKLPGEVSAELKVEVLAEEEAE